MTNRIGDGFKLLQIMKSKGVRPNTVSYNTLLYVLSLVLLEKSYNLGFVPDVVTVTKVVELLCNVGCVTEAVEVLERVKSKGGVVDIVAYNNTLMKGYCT